MQRNCLRRVIGTLCFLLLILAAHAQKYTVTGGRGTPYLAFDNKKGNTSSRFEVYLVYGMDNVEIRYTPTSSTYQWYRYKNKAGVGGDAEKIPSVNEGNTTVIRNIEEGYGYYILEDDAYSKAGGYVWIIDYSKYAFDVTSLYVDAQKSNCDNMFLGGDIDMKEMRYYDQSGVPGILKREFDITYQTMKNPEDGTAFIPETVTDTVDDPFNGFELKAPLCDTDVTLTGDLFARHFGVEKTMTTDVYQAIAVEAVMKIDTLSYASDVPNLVVKGDSLSAPVEFNFTAIANTPVAAMFNWKIYRKDEGGGSSEGNEEGEENNGTLLRDFSGEETSFIFNQNGTYVVKLTVNDRTGQCQANPPDVTVNISDSYLDVPNAFSPGTSPGINDEFRVAYRSLTRFKCWIFNRWGVEMYHWTDPSKGWDGKKGGKYVAPGVYFYVIEATGSDG
ncbi:MAG TPA: gliding motility-associated domain-containing protein, partial [Parabacteroides goldsteinii]|nr:gliding motility-associated domain-containing protein [Parabacteroides goldsteinii]